MVLKKEYIIPNYCAWCCSPDVIGKKDIDDDSNSHLSESGYYKSIYLKLSLPICQKCKIREYGKYDVLTPKKPFALHGQYLEFHNPDFHHQFAAFNPGTTTVEIKEFSFPDICAWCGNEPAITSANGIHKSKIMVPIGENCQKKSLKEKENFLPAGIFINGKLMFFNLFFWAKFTPQNPVVIYDRKQALVDDVFDEDLENSTGSMSDRSNSDWNAWDNKRNWKKYEGNRDFLKALQVVARQDSMGARDIIQNWVLACGLDEELSVTITNMIVRTMINNDYDLLRYARLENRIIWFLMLVFYENYSREKAEGILEIVGQGIKINYQQRIRLRSEVLFQKDQQEYLNLILKADDLNWATDCWSRLSIKIPDAKKTLENYLLKYWDFIDTTTASKMSETVLNNKFETLFESMKKNLSEAGNSPEVVTKNSVKVWWDLLYIARLENSLNLLPDDLEKKYDCLLA